MQQVLVTGGGGFLGSKIIEKLVEKNIKVRSLSRKRYPSLTAMGVEQIQGDIADAKLVAKACKGVDTIFHTAAKAGLLGSYNHYYQTNVKGTQNIIAACQKAPGSKLIYTSSPSVVFNGSNMEGVDESAPYPEKFCAYYPKTKALAEQNVRKACKDGLFAVILRPHLIWGPGDNHLVPQIIARSQRLRKIGYNDNKVDTIYIDNAADAHLAAETALSNNPTLSGRIYFISQDAPIDVWEMINHILAAGGKPPVIRTISFKKAYLVGMVLERVFTLLKIDRDPPMTRFLAEELSTSHWFNISAAKKDLGYEPKISIQEGLDRLKQWLDRRPLN